MLALSSGEEQLPGALVIMRNSYFLNNTAGSDNGGVVNVEKLSNLSIEGDGNVFERNLCGQDGGVLALTSSTVVTIEGGTFKENGCGEVSCVSADCLPFSLSQWFRLLFPVLWAEDSCLVVRP